MAIFCTIYYVLSYIETIPQIVKLLKGKFEITSIIGGAILIALAIWIVLEFYLI